MRLDRKQRRLLAVALLGGAAIFVDRALLGGGNGPAAASADVLLPGDNLLSTAGAPRSGAAGQPSAPANMQSVAQRLEQLREDLGALGPVADAFTIPASWKRPEPGAAAREAASAPSRSVDEFKASHSVRSISRLREGESRVVLADGRIVKVGETIGGWRLASIGQGLPGDALAAHFVAIGGGESVSLEAPRPSVPGVTVSGPR